MALGQDINSLISDIRQLNDVQLKQAAQLYKQDAMLLPLINRELTERVSMRQRMQAQQAQAQPPQPTVAEQVAMAAQQLPENSGIGQLPAENIAQMAGGGIVAFADGGTPQYSSAAFKVPNSAQRDRDMMALEALQVELRKAIDRNDTVEVGIIQKEIAQVQGRLAGAAPKGDPVPVAPTAATEAAPPAAKAAKKEDPGTPIGRFFRDVVGKAAAPSPAKAAYNRLEEQYSAKAGLPGLFMSQSPEQRQLAQEVMQTLERLRKEGNTEGILALEQSLNQAFPKPAATAAKTTQAAAPAAPAPSAGPAAPGTAPAAAPAAPAAAPGYSYSAQQAKEDAKTIFGDLGSQLDPLFQKQRERAESVNTKLREAYEAGKPKDKAYEAYEKQLLEERKGAAQEREEAKNDAIIKAGLSMLASTSPHFGVGIGQGALAGVEAYGVSKKELRAQEKERTKALSMIEQARRLEAAGQHDKAMALLTAAEDRLAAVDAAQSTAQANVLAKQAEAAAKLRQEGVQGEAGVARTAVAAAATHDKATEAEKIRIKAAEKWSDPAQRALIAAQFPNVKTFEDYLVALGLPVAGSAAGADTSSGFRVVGVR